MRDVSSEDFNNAGLSAWNSLTVLLDKNETLFDDVEEFSDFYFMIIEKLMTEEELDA